MRKTWLFAAALIAALASPLAAHAQDAGRDRTGEVIAVMRFLGDLQQGTVPDEFRASLRVYDYPAMPRDFAALESYTQQCPLKAIVLPFARPQVGPVLVSWKCDNEESGRSVGFFFEGGKLAVAGIGLDSVPRPVAIEVTPAE